MFPLLLIHSKNIVIVNFSENSLIHSKSLILYFRFFNINAHKLIFLHDVIVKILLGYKVQIIGHRLKNIPKVLQTAAFWNEHEIVEIGRLSRFQVLLKLRHDRGVDNDERLVSKVHLFNGSNSVNLDCLLKPCNVGFKQLWVDPKVAVKTLVHNASTFLLAESVDASCALIVAVKRYSDSAIPRHVNHFEPFSMPDVCLHPAKLLLADFVQVLKIS